MVGRGVGAGRSPTIGGTSHIGIGMTSGRNVAHGRVFALGPAWGVSQSGLDSGIRRCRRGSRGTACAVERMAPKGSITHASRGIHGGPVIMIVDRGTSQGLTIIQTAMGVVYHGRVPTKSRIVSEPPLEAGIRFHDRETVGCKAGI